MGAARAESLPADVGTEQQGEGSEEGGERKEERGERGGRDETKLQRKRGTGREKGGESPWIQPFLIST